MIEITNGRTFLSVTKGAFKEVFERQGFVLAKDYVHEVGKAGGLIQSAETENLNLFAETLEAKALGKWTSAELRKYAQVKGIDLSGAKDMSECKQRIKDYWTSAEVLDDDSDDDLDWDVD